MGLLPSQFWDFTLHEFILYKKGFEEMYKRNERNEWERTRWLASIVLQPHAKQGKTIKPTDFFKFDDEKEQGITLDERKRRAVYASKKLDAIEKQKNKKPKKKLF